MIESGGVFDIFFEDGEHFVGFWDFLKLFANLLGVKGFGVGVNIFDPLSQHESEFGDIFDVGAIFWRFDDDPAISDKNRVAEIGADVDFVWMEVFGDFDKGDEKLGLCEKVFFELFNERFELCAVVFPQQVDVVVFKVVGVVFGQVGLAESQGFFHVFL